MSVPFDLVIRGGTVATDEAVFDADVGISGERVVAIGHSLSPGVREIDARGKFVLPGGVDSHTHIEQISSFGIMTADDFHTATVSAAFGGTTTVMCFCAQHRRDAIPAVLADYAERARTKAVVDYAFHLIVANPDEATLTHDLPRAIEEGVRSFKIYMTYERLHLTDPQILDVMAVARKHGALVMVHAENHGVISWLGDRMIEQGNVAPRYHAICHTRGAEHEAIQRVAMLAELIDVPILIVHVSTIEGIEAIRQARARGLKVYGETCPQYLFLTAKDIDRPGVEGAMFCCSPPPRDEAAQQACWRGLADGALNVCSSDHSPYRFDETGKLPKGERTTFKEMANGVPGIELRLPLLFTFGYRAGRLSLPDFVALTATRHAQIYGCYPQKGTIAIGSDADIAIWDPEHRVTISTALVHDNAGYTPYAGRALEGWPVTVISRGEVIVENGTMRGARGRGRFVPRTLSHDAVPAGLKVPEMAQLDAWATPLRL
jgi:dihydropyrimidinase